MVYKVLVTDYPSQGSYPTGPTVPASQMIRLITTTSVAINKMSIIMCFFMFIPYFHPLKDHATVIDSANPELRIVYSHIRLLVYS